MRAKPKLTPASFFWGEDLPGPDEEALIIPTSWMVTPNHLDDSFLELPRRYEDGRGPMIWFYPFFVLFVICMWVELPIGRLGEDAWLLIIFFELCFLWVGTMQWKIEVEIPRDSPIRFNRARKRIYCYNFKYSRLNPFRRWEVTPVVYEWSQVRAEIWHLSKINIIMLSIVKPGTNQVIERFPLTGVGEHAGRSWHFVCAYMQKGPSALPPPPPPIDHNNVPWYNLSLRLAPRVQWPADMDRESRTVPCSLDKHPNGTC